MAINYKLIYILIKIICESYFEIEFYNSIAKKLLKNIFKKEVNIKNKK